MKAEIRKRIDKEKFWVRTVLGTSLVVPVEFAEKLGEELSFEIARAEYYAEKEERAGREMNVYRAKLILAEYDRLLAEKALRIARAGGPE